MQSKNHKDEMIKAIDEIVENLHGDSKTTTLCKQRGYLTGLLAVLASKDWLVRQEIEERLRQAREKSGAGTENRTRK